MPGNVFQGPCSYPELPAEGAVELEVVPPALLVLLDLREGGQGGPQLLLVLASVIQLEHGVCLQLLLVCALWDRGRRGVTTHTHTRLTHTLGQRKKRGYHTHTLGQRKKRGYHTHTHTQEQRKKRGYHTHTHPPHTHTGTEGG